MTDAPTVLVVGPGYFGRLLIHELLEFTDCHVVVAGRSKERLRKLCDRFSLANRQRLTPRIIDLNQPNTIEPLLSGVRVVVCTAGPFQSLPLTLPRACLQLGVPYIDIADDRGFVARVGELVHQTAGAADAPAVCSGWSAVPALSAVMARIAADWMDRVESIRTQIAPGNRTPRAAGTVASLLDSVGRSFDIWRDAAPCTVTGWSEPRSFTFPPPVDTRVGYLVNAPDYDVLPRLFDARMVEFRVGAEIGLLNGLTSGLAWLVRCGFVSSFLPYAGMLRRGMALFGWIGHDRGAVGVEVSGLVAGRALLRRVCVVAKRAGQRIPVMPAVIMTEKILAGESVDAGLVPFDRWLSRAELESACRRRGYELTIEEKPTDSEYPNMSPRTPASPSPSEPTDDGRKNWRRLAVAGWVTLVIHLAAGLAMAGLLRHGLETNSDLAGRLVFLAKHERGWMIAWLTWNAAAVSILVFFGMFAWAHRRCIKSASYELIFAVSLVFVAVPIDLSAEAIEMRVLPALARRAVAENPGEPHRTTVAAQFLALHRKAVLRTGFLANGLYSIATLIAVAATRRHYRRMTRAVGYLTAASGLGLSAAAWADSPQGMFWANVVLMPALLAWLAGVAVKAHRTADGIAGAAIAS